MLGPGVGVLGLRGWNIGSWVVGLRSVSEVNVNPPSLQLLPVLAVRNAGQVASISGGVQGGLSQYLVSMTN